jgi:hypothetical protein
MKIALRFTLFNVFLGCAIAVARIVGGPGEALAASAPHTAPASDSHPLLTAWMEAHHGSNLESNPTKLGALEQFYGSVLENKSQDVAYAIIDHFNTMVVASPAVLPAILGFLAAFPNFFDNMTTEQVTAALGHISKFNIKELEYLTANHEFLTKLNGTDKLKILGDIVGLKGPTRSSFPSSPPGTGASYVPFLAQLNGGLAFDEAKRAAMRGGKK